ncbi:Protein of unknown function [Pyronema omphalodes CBS 100304]|uniref:Uncharacterized protein n=1 Tax=Pyronema omphalodes (strain CBS 100304) TaxID=1076935 RepID=U4L6V3_PYROM|nr:Protein of unknown function [Pyronema omphalodes CBS 100304]
MIIDCLYDVIFSDLDRRVVTYVKHQFYSISTLRQTRELSKKSNKQP